MQNSIRFGGPMVGRQVFLSALLAIVLATSPWAQSGGAPAPAGGTVHPSAVPPSSPQSGLLASSTSRDIDPNMLGPLEQARQIQARQNLLNRIGSLEAAYYSAGLQEAIESHPAVAVPELLSNLFGPWASALDTREANSNAG